MKQGFFNVPARGVSAGGSLWAFFWTDHCSDPGPLGRSAAPLVRPRPRPGHDCPETDERTSIGRSVLARSDDDGLTFSHVAPMPKGFVYATTVNTQLAPDVPEGQRLGVFVFAVPRYRASVPCLARAPADTLADISKWQFFAGLGPGGAPTWVTREEWERGRPGARNEWNPPGTPELFVPKAEAGRSVGELSVAWNRELGLWMMLYGGPGGILARRSRSLGPVVGKFVAGGLYAPFVLNRYTTPARGVADSDRGATITWLVSTWNPYEVAVMRTTLLAEPPERAGSTEPPRERCVPQK